MLVLYETMDESGLWVWFETREEAIRHCDSQAEVLQQELCVYKVVAEGTLKSILLKLLNEREWIMERVIVYKARRFGKSLKEEKDVNVSNLHQQGSGSGVPGSARARGDDSIQPIRQTRQLRDNGGRTPRTDGGC